MGIVGDGSRPYVWTCPHCGRTTTSETAREDRTVKATHPSECAPPALKVRRR